MPTSVEFRTNVFLQLPDIEFKQMAHVSKDALQYILHEIVGHNAFQNHAANKQAPVWQ